MVIDINKITKLSNSSEYEHLINYFHDNVDHLIELVAREDDNNKLLIPFSGIVLKSYLDERKTKVSSSELLVIIRLIILGTVDHYQKYTLQESSEVRNNTTNINYIITICDDELKTKLFILYTIIYYLETKMRKINFTNKINKTPHVGIDYEFNNRKIALMQINYETVADSNLVTYSYIWLTNPNIFTKKQFDIFITHIMVNRCIYKILHGPESLDIPYMYDIMFKNDKDTIMKFTSKVIDTRYLCEYFKIKQEQDKKCSIYDALKYFKVISDEKYNNLIQTHDSMGPVQDISWNINKMSSYHIKYALYDVLFLQHFLFNIYKKINEEQKQYMTTYKYIINFTRFIFLERKEVTKIIEYCKQVVNPINNYMIKINNAGKNMTLINIYNDIIKDFVINDGDNNVYLELIMIVGYYKKIISFLFKYITYYTVQKNGQVFEKKNVPMQDKINITKLYDMMQVNNYKCILKLLKLFEESAHAKIINLL